MNAGFGWSFYGFFVAAALWCIVFNIWAVRRNARERRESRERGDDAR